jgi:hypothetical protein
MKAYRGCTPISTDLDQHIVTLYLNRKHGNTFALGILRHSCIRIKSP